MSPSEGVTGNSSQVNNTHENNNITSDGQIQSSKAEERAKATSTEYLTKERKRVLCMGGTRIALLSQIGEWMVNPEGPPIFVLNGLAGIGKTTVAQTIASRSDDLNLLGASFFFCKEEVERRNSERFFTTLVYQLCVWNEQISKAVTKVLGSDRGKEVLMKDAQEQLNVLILEPLRDILKSRQRPIVVVIDALDECDYEDSPIVLAGLRQLVQEIPCFKIFITTRPQPHLQHLLTRDVDKIFHLENIEEKIVDGDIEFFLKHCLSQEQVLIGLGKLPESWSASDDDVEFLVRMSGKFFIVAATTVLFILDKAINNPSLQMQKLRNGFTRIRSPSNAINDFYTAVLRNAVPVGSEAYIAARFRKVIGTILLIQNPLPIKPLAKLIGLSLKDLHAVIDKMRSIILVSGNDVPHVYHKTFFEYIMDSDSCREKELRIVLREHHTRIAIRCLQVMNGTLTQNILQLGNPARFMDNTPGLSHECISEPDFFQKVPQELEYACLHWADHLDDSNTKDSALVKEMEAFVNRHLLHWLEALSWSTKLHLAHPALGLLLKNLKSTSPNLRELVSGGQRFISKFSEIIKKSALHTYCTALPLAPTGSLLYKKYQRQMMFCRVQGGPENWDALIATTTAGGVVDRLGFSRDNSTLASWGDEGIKLWDATTGTPRKSLKAENAALAEDFSTVAISHGNTVTLCSVASRAPIATFQHSADVSRVMLSFDASRVVAVSPDGAVSLWNNKGRGEVIATLDGFLRQLAFSPKGDRLAFVSNAGDIRLCNGSNGNFIAKMDYKPEQALSLLFLSNGSRLASITERYKVYSLTLWKSENGELIDVIKDVGFRLATSHDGVFVATGGDSKVQLWNAASANTLSLIATLDHERISSLALSPGILAIGSFHNTVTLYDVNKRTFFATLTFEEPLALAISPDCSRLAVGGYSGTVHLWDVPSVRASVASQARTSRVTALAFSSDCLRLACGFEDGTIELRGTGRTERIIATHPAHSDQIIGLEFCGERLASISKDRSIKLWECKDGALISHFEQSLPRQPSAMAVSSALLAVGVDGHIILWNRQILRVTDTLTAHEQLEGIDSLLFSLDGSLLASASEKTHNLLVWDVRKRSTVAKFRVLPGSQRLIFAPDGSSLVSQCRDGSFTLFDIANSKTTWKTNEDLSWLPIPRWHGFQISLGYDVRGGFHRLVGRFLDPHDRTPILYIPTDFVVSTSALGSSMYAIGCEDGRVLIVRSS